MPKSKTQLKREAHEQKMRQQAADKSAREVAARPKIKRHRVDPAEWRREYSEMLRRAGSLAKPDIKSVEGVGAVKSVFDTRWNNTYQGDDEMAERERIAQAEAEEKKKRIAPAYSKGNYQYITGLEGARDAGKKNSF